MAMISKRTASLDRPSEDFDQAALDELAASDRNGRVGHTLVSETDRVRVWLINLQPGERLPFHRHVLDYFWTALTPGRARSRYSDGKVREFEYAPGETRRLATGTGDPVTHDLVNIGDAPLSFVTVEFVDGPNKPLPV